MCEKHRKISRVALTVLSKKAAYKSEKGYYKVINQSPASDNIPLCSSTAPKIKNIKCPAVNQKWWDRLMNIYPEKRLQGP